MNTLLVSYDLRKPGKDYVKLWEHLRSYGNFAKPLESLWLIRTAYNAEQARNLCRVHVDQNDKIFVVDVTGRNSAWQNVPTVVTSWIGLLL